MKIPENANPYRVIVNGVEKVYEAGATVTDDASVNEIIEAGKKYPPEAPPVAPPFIIPPIPKSGEKDFYLHANAETGEMEWVPITLPTGVPTPPTEDGTYILTATADDGEVTLAWTAEEAETTPET